MRYLSKLMLGLAAVLLVVSGAARAEYPEKPVTYIIPFGPGGESDITARMQQPFFKKYTGQELVIQYKPGGGGSIGWSQLNGMKADGYTIMGTNLPHIVLQPLLKDVGYQTDDINTVYFFHYTPDAILVQKDSPFNTLQDLIEHARKNPGALTFSGSGTNSANHLLQQRFSRWAGITTTYVPFKGTGAAVTALLGGQVTAQAGYSTVAVNYDTKALAVAAEERLPILPDVPTFKELGFDLVSGAYRGMAMPKGTPKDIQQKFSEIADKINNDPDFIKQMNDKAFVVVDIGIDKVSAFMEEKKSEYTTIAKEMGLLK